MNTIEHMVTFLYEHPPKPYLEYLVQTTPAFIDNRWGIPFFNIWLPEIGPFAARGYCLIPDTSADNANIASDKKADDAGSLRSYQEYRDVW